MGRLWYIISGGDRPDRDRAGSGGTPNNILDVLQGGSVQVDWSFSGPGTGLLNLAEFTVQLFADPVGPAPNLQVGAVTVPGTINAFPPAATSYTAAIAIPPGVLAVGAYRLTTLITSDEGGVSLPIAGFVDGPIIQVRPAP